MFQNRVLKELYCHQICKTPLKKKIASFLQFEVINRYLLVSLFGFILSIFWPLSENIILLLLFMNSNCVLTADPSGWAAEILKKIDGCTFLLQFIHVEDLLQASSFYTVRSFNFSIETILAETGMAGMFWIKSFSFFVGFSIVCTVLLRFMF